MTDREKLIELQKTNCTAKKCQSSCYECMADHLIANDVTIQKHGRWLYDSATGIAFCSECQCDAVEAVTDYCPNCGAKMDGEV